MHSSRMRTACSLPYGGSLSRGVSLTETHLDKGPLDRDPLDRDPLDRDPSEQRPRSPLWTNTCENITFTNFVCGR